MFYGYRSTILIAGLVFTGLILFGYLLTFILILNTGWIGFEQIFSRVQNTAGSTWWLFHPGERKPGWLYIWYLAGLFALLLICLVSSFVLTRIYRRTASAEIFFFLFFLYSISFEAIWLWNAIAIVKSAPIFLGITLSKVVHFGRFFGLISLLFSSLYAIEISYQKFPILMLSPILVALALTYVLPIDSSVLMTSFLYKLGDEKSHWIVTLALEVVTVLNYLIAAYRREKNQFVWIATGVFLILLGRELLSFMLGPLTIVLSLVLAVAGIWLFSKKIYRLYLWT
jgi:hypothetical protein